MTEEQGSAVVPASVVWTLNSLRDPEQKPRTYAQRELAIEGESALVGLVMRVGGALKEAGFDFDRLSTIFDDGPTDWSLVVDVVSIASAVIPDVATEAALIFLGVYRTNLDGSPNAEQYESERTFLRGAINVARVIDLVRIYAAQNDYRRALRPFTQALGARTGLGPQPSDSDGDSSSDGPRRLYGPDWTPPAARQTPTPTTAPPRASETEPSSGPSPSSSLPATARPRRSSGSTPDAK